jgi:subfamily B ATP-binding cassette protein MsbA
MKPLKELAPYLKPHLPKLLLGISGMAIFTLLRLVPPLILRYVVNDIVVPNTWQLLLPAVALLFFVPLSAAFVRFINIRIITLSANKLIADLRKGLYEKVLHLSMRYHQDNPPGFIVNRLMDDVNIVIRLISGETLRIIINLIVFVVALVIVLTISPLLGSLIFLVVFSYGAAYRIFSKRIRQATTSYRNTYDRIADRLEETVAGVRHVRIYNREMWENDLFVNRAAENLGYAFSSRMSSVGLSTACNLIAGFGSAAIVSLGAFLVLRGTLLYGDILAISSYLWMALRPAIQLTNIAGQLTETFVSVKRVIEMLAENPDIKSIQGALSMPRGKGEIQYRNVYFSYDPKVPLFQDLSLKIDAGHTVALVGRTGCGKTTLTSLLMRYWDIQDGEILIDGTDISTVDVGSLRHLFGIVLQDPIIFNGTLRENICYGDPGVPIEKIEKAARVAEIYDMAVELPEGFDTLLGSGGVHLSVGEKQRVSIARAILKDPMILVMDEATSSLDSESETLIQNALVKVLKGRTSIVVAHRLSTIVTADMIVYMDAGKILEKGTHAELLDRRGGYYELYRELQSQVDQAVV